MIGSGSVAPLEQESAHRPWRHGLLLAGSLLAIVLGVDWFAGGAVGLVGLAGGLESMAAHFMVNALAAFFFGWLATALIQSSSAVTSVAVVLVLHGLPLQIALPVVLGANIGTTATVGFIGGAWLSSWGGDLHVRGIAWLHTLVNVIGMSVFLLWLVLVPVSNPLMVVSSLAAGVLQVAPAPVEGSWLDAVQAGWLHFCSWLFGGLRWPGLLIEALVGLASLLLGLRWASQLLQQHYATGAARVLSIAVESGAWRAFGIGVFVTVIFISSSVVTCMLLPLAASGLLIVSRAVPLVLGANLGTTLTALGVALAFDGAERPLALQLAAFHILVNFVLALAVIGIVPIRAGVAQLALRITEQVASTKYPARRTLAAMLVLHFVVPASALTLLMLL